MTQLSESFRKTAIRLINRFGKDGYTIRRNVEAESLPETPTVPGEVETQEYPIKAVFVDYTTEQIDGVQVLRGDRQVIMAHAQDIPDGVLPGDLFVDGETVYSVVPPMQIVGVNGVDVVCIIQVRK